MLGNQDLSTISLQSDLESDEENGTVLTAKDQTKWKKVQVGEQSTGMLASHNILKECPGPSNYARRNIQAGSPASALLLLWTSLYLNTSVSATSLKLIDKPKTKNFVSQTMNCLHSLLSCTHEE